MRTAAAALACLALAAGSALAAPSAAPGEIVFVGSPAASGPAHVYGVHSAGGGLRTLPLGERGAAWWSPDGSKVVVSRDSLTIMRADGSDPVRLHVPCSGGCDVAWAPDGRRIVYTVIERCATGACPARLVRVNADGSGRKVLLRFQGATVSSPAWAPDGAMIAFVEAAGGVQDLNLVGASGKGFRRLAPADGGSFFPGYRPVWTTDGTRILFSAKRAGKLRVLSVARNGTDLQTLTDGWWPTLSPNGKRVAFLVPGGKAYVAPLKGGAAKLVAKAVGSPLAWSPDGTELAYVSSTSRVRVARSDGGGSRNVTKVFAELSSLAWRPSG